MQHAFFYMYARVCTELSEMIAAIVEFLTNVHVAVRFSFEAVGTIEPGGVVEFLRLSGTRRYYRRGGVLVSKSTCPGECTPTDVQPTVSVELPMQASRQAAALMHSQNRAGQLLEDRDDCRRRTP